MSGCKEAGIVSKSCPRALGIRTRNSPVCGRKLKGNAEREKSSLRAWLRTSWESRSPEFQDLRDDTLQSGAAVHQRIIPHVRRCRYFCGSWK
jgi:hypothetical protein